MACAAKIATWRAPASKAAPKCCAPCELDPQMADATAVLGVYNYYVDTLSPIVKLLRFFMGIPGRQQGRRNPATRSRTQPRRAHGRRCSIHFGASLLRQYDLKYEQALSLAEPLAARYPHQPLFLLLVGNLNAELGRSGKAAEYFHSALQVPIPDPVCYARIHEMAASFLASSR